MLLKILCTILLVNIYLAQAAEDGGVCSLERLGNLTIKYGASSEVHFQLTDGSNQKLISLLEAMQAAQIQFFAELTAKIDKLQLAKTSALTATGPGVYSASCAEAGAQSRRSGVYQLLLPGYSVYPFLASCNEDEHEGGWTVILRREDGSVNFYRYWNDYKKGFGNVNGEFFIGLDLLHIMTKGQDQELLILMENMAGQLKFAKYDRFAVGNEKDLYNLRLLGEFSGDGGDSLTGHVGNNFSSRDRDNDQYEGNCAEMYTGGWWYNKCHSSNLMGKYNESTYGKGINWLQFSGHNASLKSVVMMIRPIR